jgi:hypothetical protein
VADRRRGRDRGWGTANAIADARAERSAELRDAAIAASPLTRVVAVGDAAVVRATIDALLSAAKDPSASKRGSGATVPRLVSGVRRPVP